MRGFGIIPHGNSLFPWQTNSSENACNSVSPHFSSIPPLF